MMLSSHMTSRLIKIVVVLAIVASLTWAGVTHGEEYLSQLKRLQWSTLVAGLTICCLYRLCNAHGWWFVLRAVRQRLPAATALRVWLSSEACRWLPGSVWNFGSRALLGARAGVAPVPAAASLALELGLTLAAWVIVAGVCFPLCGADVIAKGNLLTPRFQSPAIVLSVFLITVVGGYVAWRVARRCAPGKFARATELLSKLRQAKPEPTRCLVAFGYYGLMVVFSGVGLFCLIHLMNRDVDIPVAAVVGANALAWLVGFFAVVAPGGLVIREGSLAVVLAVWMPLEQAVAVAVVWRVLQIGAELVCVLIVFAPAAVLKLWTGSRDLVRGAPQSQPAREPC